MEITSWVNAGCIYAMPINRCPFCDEEFASDNSGGLLILPIEPFSTSAPSQGGEGEDDRASREAEQQSRFAIMCYFDVIVVVRCGVCHFQGSISVKVRYMCGGCGKFLHPHAPLHVSRFVSTIPVRFYLWFGATDYDVFALFIHWITREKVGFRFWWNDHSLCRRQPFPDGFIPRCAGRTGRWHSFETMYAQRIVSDFDAGTLPLCEGTKLGNLLCNILNCSPS